MHYFTYMLISCPLLLILFPKHKPIITIPEYYFWIDSIFLTSHAAFFHYYFSSNMKPIICI